MSWWMHGLAAALGGAALGRIGGYPWDIVGAVFGFAVGAFASRQGGRR